jgi:hypothetical protein
VRNIAESKDDTTFSNYLQFVLNKDVFGDLLPLREVLLLLPCEEWEKKFYFSVVSMSLAASTRQ